MKLIKVAFFLLAMCCMQTLYAQEVPTAVKGVMDASNHDFAAQGALKLSGEWAYYHELVAPQEFSNKRRFINFPHLWHDSSSIGVATYQLTLITNSPTPLALEIPQLYCSYTLWVNGKQVAKNGVVSTTRKGSEAQWLPQIVALSDRSDTLFLSLQIANFHHSIGGIKNPIYLGLPERLLSEQQSSHIVNTILLGVLTFIGVFFLNIYFFVKREKAVLYFSLACLTWALRSIFSEQYLAIHWMPWFDWELAVKIEYITLYLQMAWAILFISHLYPLDTNKIVKRILLYPNYVFVFLSMATPALLYTQFLTIYLVLAGALLLYVFFIIMRAMVFERYGAWFSVLGILSLACAFGYNYLSYQGLFEFYPLALYTSYLIFFLFLAIALAYQLSPKAGAHNYSESLSFDDFVKK
jgi:7TM diverse intracellular signalling